MSGSSVELPNLPLQGRSKHGGVSGEGGKVSSIRLKIIQSRITPTRISFAAPTSPQGGGETCFKFGARK